MGVANDLLTNYQHIIKDLTLTTGANGVFEVKVDGELVYSKNQTGRHAEDGEVLRIFRNLAGPDVTVFSE